MKIKLTAQITGTRNGEAWPVAGSVVDLPDDEAKAMIVNRTAEGVDQEGKELQALVGRPPAVETGLESHAFQHPATMNAPVEGLTEDGTTGRAEAGVDFPGSDSSGEAPAQIEVDVKVHGKTAKQLQEEALANPVQPVMRTEQPPETAAARTPGAK